VAVLSVHTSPLEQPGTGDAGGMNVYIRQTATRMARRGVAVDVFTRATSSEQPPAAELAPGVTVRHVAAGPFEGLEKQELPGQLCAFTAGVLRAEARHEAGYYQAVHSHYWLSGQVGWLARERWGVPLIHSAHTLGRVKNANLAAGDAAEPRTRVIGEQQVAREADLLVANTAIESRELIGLYGAASDKVLTVAPGVDLDSFTPRSTAIARSELGLATGALVIAFVGRIQPLKAPDVLLRSVAEMLQADPGLRQRLTVLVVGGPSGSGVERPEALARLGADLGIADVLRFLPPQRTRALAQVYRAADMVAVPSHSESFGLVALEAQACGTPVVAANVGGLGVAVADGVSGRLVHGHEPAEWARALGKLARDADAREAMSAAAVEQAQRFSWEKTTDELLGGYARAARRFSASPPDAAQGRELAG
jgi:D-inositol-3-phosphate glycosyltransferase